MEIEKIDVKIPLGRSIKPMNSLGSGPTMNVRENIIAGPKSGQYWNHSPNYERPEIREEGPFPVQGNIGSLMSLDPTYKSCSPLIDNVLVPDINSSPNCAGVFKPDIYTTQNTCGVDCEMKFPESYGDKDFGYPEKMPWYYKTSNAHQVHTYMNLRAGMPGQGPENNMGCYEWIPNVSSDKETNSCVLNQEEVYNQVGSWNKLKQFSNMQNVYYNNN